MTDRGPEADSEFGGNLFAGQSFPDQFQYFPLAARQCWSGFSAGARLRLLQNRIREHSDRLRILLERRQFRRRPYMQELTAVGIRLESSPHNFGSLPVGGSGLEIRILRSTYLLQQFFFFCVAVTQTARRRMNYLP